MAAPRSEEAARKREDLLVRLQEHVHAAKVEVESFITAANEVRRQRDPPLATATRRRNVDGR